MKGIFKFVLGLHAWGFAIWFIQWYIRGHFSKYFIFFWLNTIISITMGYNFRKEMEQEEKNRNVPGWVIYEQKRQNSTF